MWLAVGLVVIIAGVIVWLVFVQKPSEPAISTMTGPYKFHTEHIYHNDKFGFEVQMPSTWTRYAVHEEQEENEYIIWFALPLQGTTTVELLSEPEHSAHVIDVDWFEIMSIAYFNAHKHDCDNADGPCLFPIEIMRDKNYVYGSGVPWPHVGWDYCGVGPGAKPNLSEPYVCAVRRDFWIPQEDRSIFEKTFKLTR